MLKMRVYTLFTPFLHPDVKRLHRGVKRLHHGVTPHVTCRLAMDDEEGVSVAAETLFLLPPPHYGGELAGAILLPSPRLGRGRGGVRNRTCVSPPAVCPTPPLRSTPPQAWGGESITLSLKIFLIVLIVVSPRPQKKIGSCPHCEQLPIALMSCYGGLTTPPTRPHCRGGVREPVSCWSL